jgi:hypothetical protein
VFRSSLIAGRATLTTVPSRKTIVEPRIVATSVRTLWRRSLISRVCLTATVGRRPL